MWAFTIKLSLQDSHRHTILCTADTCVLPDEYRPPVEYVPPGECARLNDCPLPGECTLPDE